MLLAALVPALGAATAVSLWRPSLALLIWIALLPVQLDTVGSLGFRLAPADVLLAGIVLGVLIRKLRSRRLGLTVNGVLVVALLLLLWLVSSLLQTVANLGHIPVYAIVNKLLGLALLVSLYWVTLELHGTKQAIVAGLDWYRRAGSLWNVVGIVAFTVWQVWGWDNPFVFGEGRLCGLLVDPNAYGGFLVSVLLLEITRLSLDARSRVAATVNTVVLFYGTLLTSSRSAWLALVFGAAGLFVVLRGRERVRLALIGALLAAELVIFFAVLSPSSVELAMRVPQIEARVSLTAEAVRSFSSSALRGIGLGVFQTLPGSGGAIVHSTYFWLLAETGLPGLMLLLCMIGIMWWQYRRVPQLGGLEVRTPATAAFAVIVAWLGLMLGIEAFYQRHFWFLAALLGALHLWAVQRRKGTQLETHDRTEG